LFGVATSGRLPDTRAEGAVFVASTARPSRGLGQDGVRIVRSSALDQQAAERN
jgi:hypothetical protein